MWNLKMGELSAFALSIREHLTIITFVFLFIKNDDTLWIVLPLSQRDHLSLIWQHFHVVNKNMLQCTVLIFKIMSDIVTTFKACEKKLAKKKSIFKSTIVFWDMFGWNWHSIWHGVLCLGFVWMAFHQKNTKQKRCALHCVQIGSVMRKWKKMTFLNYMEVTVDRWIKCLTVSWAEPLYQ